MDAKSVIENCLLEMCLTVELKLADITGSAFSILSKKS